jgi:hypothetical protein
MKKARLKDLLVSRKSLNKFYIRQKSLLIAVTKDI